MKLIGLQSGHQNIQSNIDPILRGGTGASPANFTPEIQWTPKVRDELCKILLTKKNADGTPAFQLQLDDANANGSVNTLNQDFDFYLAIHFEANTHGTGGGFMTAPDASVDASNTESKRIVQAIKGKYFSETGIVENEAWITPAMTYYYMWNVLTAKTPCGIIECGVGGDAHDDVILGDITRVATAIARGICVAFDVPFDYVAPVPPVPAPIPPVQPVPVPTIPPQPPVVTPKELLAKIKTIVDGNWSFWPLSKTFWRNNLLKLKELI